MGGSLPGEQAYGACDKFGGHAAAIHPLLHDGTHPFPVPTAV
jgi:hypothetical protein